MITEQIELLLNELIKDLENYDTMIHSGEINQKRSHRFIIYTLQKFILKHEYYFKELIDQYELNEELDFDNEKEFIKKNIYLMVVESEKKLCNQSLYWFIYLLIFKKLNEENIGYIFKNSNEYFKNLREQLNKNFEMDFIVKEYEDCIYAKYISLYNVFFLNNYHFRDIRKHINLCENCQSKRDKLLKRINSFDWNLKIKDLSYKNTDNSLMIQNHRATKNEIIQIFRNYFKLNRKQKIQQNIHNVKIVLLDFFMVFKSKTFYSSIILSLMYYFILSLKKL